MSKGASVYVNADLPGWGGALDRFGKVERVSLAHLMCYVRTASRGGWVRIEDLREVAS